MPRRVFTTIRAIDTAVDVAKSGNPWKFPLHRQAHRSHVRLAKPPTESTQSRSRMRMARDRVNALRDGFTTDGSRLTTIVTTQGIARDG